MIVYVYININDSILGIIKNDQATLTFLRGIDTISQTKDKNNFNSYDYYFMIGQLLSLFTKTMQSLTILSI